MLLAFSNVRDFPETTFSFWLLATFGNFAKSAFSVASGNRRATSRASETVFPLSTATGKGIFGLRSPSSTTYQKVCFFLLVGFSVKSGSRGNFSWAREVSGSGRARARWGFLAA